MTDLYVDPGDTVVRPVIRGGTIYMGQGARVIEPDIDCEGGLYGIKSEGPHVVPKNLKEFLALRSVVVMPKIRNAANKATLTQSMEIRGGDIKDCGNDPWASNGPWSIVHGNSDYPLTMNLLGNRELDPDGHSDGCQPWHSHFMLRGATIDLRDSDGAGEKYAEAGAGVYIEEESFSGDFEDIWIVRNRIITTHGYCVRVVESSAGSYPEHVIVTDNIFDRQDGKYPVDIPQSVTWHNNRRPDGTLIKRFGK